MAKKRLAAGVSPISGVAPPKHSRFKPGHAGGPGRPKGNLIDRIRRRIENGRFRTKDGIKTVPDVIARKLMRMAAHGDMAAIAFIANRLYGKVPDRIAGPDGEPIKMVVEVKADEVCGDVNKPAD